MFRPRPHSRHTATVAASIVVLVVAASSGGLADQGPAGAAPARHDAADPAQLPGALSQIIAPTTPATAGPMGAPTTPTATPIAAAVPSPVPASTLAADGIPTTALHAYERAAAQAPHSCHIPWPLVAAIGRVESDHGRFAGSVLHTDGVSTPGIVGIPLDGHGTEVVRDTDHGTLDGDRTYDRAVGPMQFIPSTWARWHVDADHDGKADVNDIDDAAAATANYLCAAGGDLRTYAGQRRGVLSYNHSTAYLKAVLDLEQVYARGVITVPTAPGKGDARLPHPTPAPTTATAPTTPKSSAEPTPSRTSPVTSPTTKPGTPTTSPTSPTRPCGSTTPATPVTPTTSPSPSSGSTTTSTSTGPSCPTSPTTAPTRGPASPTPSGS